jgi:hypothetical protein
LAGKNRDVKLFSLLSCPNFAGESSVNQTVGGLNGWWMSNGVFKQIGIIGYSFNDYPCKTDFDGLE